ncbi:tubulin epsilon and delta complex protein 2 [Manacus vitellinus]|uniref:tubulin epsilon and delta complex protein 2 n=1 Tax=Manacus vitellinus TaxID=328815 RepID=UPI00115DDD14|nr:tubulin epsilon and delta complex protein 2 [Manacus vitellinus]
MQIPGQAQRPPAGLSRDPPAAVRIPRAGTAIPAGLSGIPPAGLSPGSRGRAIPRSLPAAGAGSRPCRARASPRPSPQVLAGPAAAALRAALGAGAERRRELWMRRASGAGRCCGRGAVPLFCDLTPLCLFPPTFLLGVSLESRLGNPENRPSPKELEELELLNRALEKALKVRKSILKSPLEAPGATGKKLAGEGPAAREAEEQQVPVPVEDVPESTKVGTGSKKPGSSKKPSAYQLRAPYRTDPDVKKPQRKAPARCVSQGPRTSGKSSSKGVASKQRGSQRTATGSATEVCAPAEPQKTLGSSKSAPNEQQSFSVGDSAGGKNSIAAGQELFDAGKKSCGFLGESSKKEDTAGASGRSLSPGTGILWEKGCQLKLPLPYRIAYSRNSRAWEKCHLCQTSADAAAARARFMERIQTTFCSPKADFSPAEIEEELRVLQDVSSHLRQYVEAETADPPTLQREYESLLTLEGLQTTVAQCLQKLQLLRAALESQLRLRPDCTGDVGSCSPACVPARGQICDTAGVLALPLLCYSSFQELRDLFALKLQVSMLHQEIALQKVLMAELLPVLEPSPCPEGSARLFRAIHTQLCQGGRSFPVLVRDELGD